MPFRLPRKDVLLTRTLRLKIHRPTKRKAERLRWLWANWGRTGYKMHDNMARRYPTKRVLNQWGCLGLRENPNSTVARWWLRLPVTKGELVNLPVRGAQAHLELLDLGVKVCNSELVRRGREFYIHLTIQREVSPPLTRPKAVLAVDIGERVVATSVTWDGIRIREPRFDARAVRGIRRTHAWLRKRLQERGHFRGLVRIGPRERRQVDDSLNKAAKAIVARALQADALIVMGVLSGIRVRSTDRGTRFASMVNAMPFDRLSRLVEDKAAWSGVAVILVREDYSSIECHICNERGRRPSQGLFLCPSCGEYNADLNGAANIGKRAFRYIQEVGARGFEPEGGKLSFHETAQATTWPMTS